MRHPKVTSKSKDTHDVLSAALTKDKRVGGFSFSDELKDLCFVIGPVCFGTKYAADVFFPETKSLVTWKTGNQFLQCQLRDRLLSFHDIRRLGCCESDC